MAMLDDQDRVIICDPSPVSRYLWRWGWKRPLGTQQFGLASLFAIVTLVALVLGVWHHWNSQQAPYHAIRALGAKVSVSNQGRVYVDLSDTNVTDDQLTVLCRVQAEMSLNLSATAVTDAAIDHLIRVPHLERVDVSGTNVSESGIRRLVESRLDCSVGPFFVKSESSFVD